MARRLAGWEEIIRENAPKKRFSVSNEVIQEMLSALNIVDVLSDEYGLVLDHQRAGEYRGHCPFPDHRDSDPSFDVNTEKGVYHCWGCDRSGNLITFFMEIEGLSFTEALIKLGTLSGINLGEYDSETHKYIHDLKEMVKDYVDTYAETDLPGGISVSQFMTIIARKMRKYEEKVDGDPLEVEWVDSIYKQFDEYDDLENYKAMSNLWKSIGSMLNKRYNAYKERINS